MITRGGWSSLSRSATATSFFLIVFLGVDPLVDIFLVFFVGLLAVLVVFLPVFLLISLRGGRLLINLVVSHALVILGRGI